MTFARAGHSASVPTRIDTFRPSLASGLKGGRGVAGPRPSYPIRAVSLAYDVRVDRTGGRGVRVGPSTSLLALARRLGVGRFCSGRIQYVR